MFRGRENWQLGEFANVKVPTYAPQYETLRKKIEAGPCDPYEWKVDEDGALWVSYHWLK